MDRHIEYEKILEDQILGSVFALILVFVLAIVLLVVNIKLFSKDLGAIGRTLVNLFISVVIIAATAYFSLHIYHLQDDIQTQAYVSYYGEFSVSDDRNGYVTLKGGDHEITLSGKVDLSGGEYIGKIVYSEKSKHLLDWEVGGD